MKNIFNILLFYVLLFFSCQSDSKSVLNETEFPQKQIGEIDFLSSFESKILSANWDEILLMSEIDFNLKFGYSVSVSGNRALVGILNDQVGTVNYVYVFQYNGLIWEETAKFNASDTVDGDGFGKSVSLSGDRALIGAPLNGGVGISGAAYVFYFDGDQWIEETKLLPSDGSDHDLFGEAVSLDGNRVLVGSPRDDDNGSSSGSAYLFEYVDKNWVQTSKLLPSDGFTLDVFGSAISLSGDRALVGAYLNDDNGTGSGSAYIFDYDGNSWIQMTKLLASDAAAVDNFGEAVSLSGDRAIVGARRDEDNGNDSGSAYVFDYDGNTWLESDKLLPSDGAEYEFFGAAVSLVGDRVLIGSPSYSSSQDNNGAAYLFEFNGNGWDEQLKLTPTTNSNGGDYFGGAVSLSQKHILVGSPSYKNLTFCPNFEPGRAYVFTETDLIFKDQFE